MNIHIRKRLLITNSILWFRIFNIVFMVDKYTTNKKLGIWIHFIDKLGYFKKDIYASKNILR